MAEPPDLTIRRNFPRPTIDQVAHFAGAASGHVADALGRRGALDHRIRCLTRASAFTGVALTVRTRERDNLAPWAAIKFARPGDVIVVETGSTVEASVLGDVLVGIARNQGVVALVTDGLARDVAGMNAVGIPVFARGVTPNSPHKTGPGWIGLPIALGGQPIDAGDVLVGDSDGVVVVPRLQLDAIARELDVVRRKEVAMDERVRSGATEPAWLGGTLDKLNVTYLD
jgi:4-hydroxy-4-methyl-2-oxoglutarate aldolase